jgi:acetylornithine deacetylase/succinyl-diaminopimelate desuccinylase-like protein
VRVKDYTAVDASIAAQMPRWTAELIEFCSIPSESRDRAALSSAEEWVTARLERLGCSVEVIGAEDAPSLVVAEIGEGPTVTCVQHYDVQPGGPLDLWTSPPYEPVVTDGRLVARGAEDNKGEFLARVWGLEAYVAAFGTLPCRVRFLVEGEEEIGSPHRAAYLDRRPELRRADGALMEGGGVGDDGRPIVQCGIRGILVLELAVQTIAYDGHSSLAALLPNAAVRMSQAVASLFDPEGRPEFDGLLDDIVSATAEQLALVDALPDGLADMFLHAFQIDRFVAGRSGGAAKRAAVLEPTCNISGLWSGYTAEGVMTITPAEAHARIDIRLVPDQDPDAILSRLREHLDARGFGDVKVMKLNWGTRAYWSPPSAPIVRAASSAAESIWGTPPSILVTDPGTAPMWDVCAAEGVPLADFGAATPASRAHAPDENIRLDHAEKAARVMVRFVDEFARSIQASQVS